MFSALTKGKLLLEDGHLHVTYISTEGIVHKVTYSPLFILFLSTII